MNIYIPYYWLLEHLETKATPEEIARCLSLCGPSVERIEVIEGEPVLEIEVTTNRVDCMSVRGVAREAAVILPEFGIRAKLEPLELPKVNGRGELGIKIVNNSRLCKRILAVRMSDLKMGSSPAWMQKRLTQVGQRPLNNLIDITNYVMWEIGHPVHIFDFNRLEKGKIIVREAKKGEKLVTLDGKEHVLNGGEVIFDNDRGEIIDLPGIMGTENTVVTSETKETLLWIESIDAVKIRNASMGMAIRSQAAILNEKAVDPELAATAMMRCVQLYQELAGARVKSGLVDIYPMKSGDEPVVLEQRLINNYMGLEVEPKRITRILEALGVGVKQLKSGFRLTSPSWRKNDLQVPVDYVEEVSRIYGYHNLPGKVMAKEIPDYPARNDFNLEQKIKVWLSDWGLQEVYTYSMVSEEIASRSGIPLESHLKIKNPLSEEWVYLRQSIIPSHVKVLKDNPTNSGAGIFEMANVYIQQGDDLPEEKLCLVVTTRRSYTYLRGILGGLMSRIYRKVVVELPVESTLHFLKQGVGSLYIATENKPVQIGRIGRVDCEGEIYALELWMEPLSRLARRYPRYTPLASFPSVIQDFTFEMPDKTYLGPVIGEIEKKSGLVKEVKLLGSYRNAKTFRIWFQDPKRNLTDEEVRPIRDKIIAVVEKEFGGRLK